MHDAQIMKSVMETYGATHKGITEQHRHELDVLGYTVFEDVIEPIWSVSYTHLTLPTTPYV